MNLTAAGMFLILIGIILLVTAPLINIQIIGGGVADVSGLTCIVVFFIPFCFSLGVPPMITALFALMILVIFGIFTYIAFRVYRSALGRSKV